MQMPIYLDNASTTQLYSEVLEEILPYFTQFYGNSSSSTHAFGWRAKGGVNWANSMISSVLNCDISEIVYTSGATESINTVLNGIFESYKLKGKHLVVAPTEHKAVLDFLEFLKTKGAEITFLNVDEGGLINLEELASVIQKDTIAVVLMWVNNETGVIQDIENIARLVADKQSILVCDASQALGKIKIDFKNIPIGVLIGSAHKFHGPKGVGFHLIRRKNPRVSVSPLILGGAQQNGRRSGTLNVPGIVGMAKALELSSAAYLNPFIHQQALFLQNELIKLGYILNGSTQSKLPFIINLRSATKAHDLIKNTPQLAYSLGSACNSENQLPSHVLKAMNLSNEEAFCSFRLSLSTFTTQQDIETTIDVFKINI